MFEELRDSELLIIYPFNFYIICQSINISISNILKNIVLTIMKVNFLDFVIETLCMN